MDRCGEFEVLICVVKCPSIASSGKESVSFSEMSFSGGGALFVRHARNISTISIEQAIFILFSFLIKTNLQFLLKMNEV